MTHLPVLIRPLMSEKASRLGEAGAQGADAAGRGPTYTFQVVLTANKARVRLAVEEHYKVRVAQVRTLVLPGKSRRRGARVYRRPARKKAFVTLRGGQTIDLLAQEG